MDPTRVDRIRGGVTMDTSITPFPTVVATWTPKVKAATKLKKAAQTTAWRGERTRVETMVATELAASFIPLTKSKIRARAMHRKINGDISGSSGIFQDDALGNVGDILAAVGGPLEVFQDILPFDELEGVLFLEEQPGQGAALDVIGLVLETLDLHRQGEHLLPVLHAVEQGDE